MAEELKEGDCCSKWCKEKANKERIIKDFLRYYSFVVYDKDKNDKRNIPMYKILHYYLLTH